MNDHVLTLCSADYCEHVFHALDCLQIYLSRPLTMTTAESDARSKRIYLIFYSSGRSHRSTDRLCQSTVSKCNEGKTFHEALKQYFHTQITYNKHHQL